MDEFSGRNKDQTAGYTSDPYGWERFRLKSQETVPVKEQHQGYSTRAQDSRKPKKKWRFGTAAVMLCIALFGGLIGSAATYLWVSGSTDAIVKQAVERAVNTVALTPSSTSGSASHQTSDFSGVVEKASESVVAISAIVPGQGGRYYGGTAQSDGSGVIISADGYIVTCKHVIDGASSIAVYLNNGKQYSATVKGSDTKTDIAVLKINATNLTPIVIGDSGKLRLGESVIVIGNPLGELNGSVTLGVVSAVNRTIQIDNGSMTVLQTDAAINPGNSGGALLNSQGQLVGIVNAKSSGVSVEGLGFAIPFNNIQSIVVQLETYGYVKDR